MPQQPTPEHVHVPGVAPDDLRLIVEKTVPAVWQALRGQCIFITGGTGFIGCWLLEALIWANRHCDLDLQLLVLTRRPMAFAAKAPHLAHHPSVQLLEGNVSNLGHFNQPVDMVLHAATDVARPGGDPCQVFADIVDGTKQTLALATRCKARRYLLTSSGAVYGRQPDGMTHIAEHYVGAPDTLQPDTAYGQAKRVSEWLVQCHSLQHGLDTRIARIFALIGPYLPLEAHFAAGNFIRDALGAGEIKMHGDGSAYRSYMYTADMVVWLLTILINGTAGQAYNVGSDQALTIGQLAQTIIAAVPGARAGPATDAVPGTPASRYVPDIGKAQKELKLLVHTDLPSAIRKTVDWAKKMAPPGRTRPTHHDVSI